MAIVLLNSLELGRGDYAFDDVLRKLIEVRANVKELWHYLSFFIKLKANALQVRVFDVLQAFHRLSEFSHFVHFLIHFAERGHQFPVERRGNLPVGNTIVSCAMSCKVEDVVPLVGPGTRIRRLQLAKKLAIAVSHSAEADA